MWLQDSQVFKDSLYPLRSSIKRNETPSIEACATATSAKKEPQHEIGVQSAFSENANTTQNAGSNWCLQGTQVLRCFASRASQTIWKHLFKLLPFQHSGDVKPEVGVGK
jgi:hypothetical protein